MITNALQYDRQMRFSARVILCVSFRVSYAFVIKARVPAKSNDGNKGRMSKGVMSERDNTSASVATSGACCRMRRRMQCFGFQGNSTN